MKLIYFFSSIHGIGGSLEEKDDREDQTDDDVFGGVYCGPPKHASLLNNTVKENGRLVYKI